MRANPYARWGKGATSDEPGNDPKSASNRIGNGLLNLSLPATTRISPDMRVFTMGSCFAREIEAALVQAGYSITSVTPGMRTNPLFLHNGKGEPGFLNRFNTASMLLEFRNLLDGGVIPDDALVIGADGDEIYDGHYLAVCPVDSVAKIAERRAFIRSEMRGALDADIFILTLGLNESCFDLRSGLYRNVSPTVKEMKRRDGLEVHVLGFAENMANLEAIRALILKHSTRTPRIFVTVSPVPLDTTFQDTDVIVANDAAKGVLRAVAYEFSESHDDVFYFPSFEIVMRSELSRSFKGDLRHVQRECVQHITSAFLASHEANTPLG